MNSKIHGSMLGKHHSLKTKEWKLNRFDPPVKERFGERDLLNWGTPERSPSGYLIEKEICGRCHGWGKTYGLVMEVTLAL